MTLSKIKDRIIETDKGYFYDTEAGYYIKLSEEIEDVIDAPASDFQEEGERWATVEDLLDEQLDNIPSIQPKTTSTDIEEVRKEYFIAVGQGKVKDIETAWTWFAPHLSNKSELKKEAVREGEK